MRMAGFRSSRRKVVVIAGVAPATPSFSGWRSTAELDDQSGIPDRIRTYIETGLEAVASSSATGIKVVVTAGVSPATAPLSRKCSKIELCYQRVVDANQGLLS